MFKNILCWNGRKRFGLPCILDDGKSAVSQEDTLADSCLCCRSDFIIPRSNLLRLIMQLQENICIHLVLSWLLNIVCTFQILFPRMYHFFFSNEIQESEKCSEPSLTVGWPLCPAWMSGRGQATRSLGLSGAKCGASRGAPVITALIRHGRVIITEWPLPGRVNPRVIPPRGVGGGGGRQTTPSVVFILKLWRGPKIFLFFPSLTSRSAMVVRHTVFCISRIEYMYRLGYDTQICRRMQIVPTCPVSYTYAHAVHRLQYRRKKHVSQIEI